MKLDSRVLENTRGFSKKLGRVIDHSPSVKSFNPEKKFHRERIISADKVYLNAEENKSNHCPK